MDFPSWVKLTDLRLLHTEKLQIKKNPGDS